MLKVCASVMALCAVLALTGCNPSYYAANDPASEPAMQATG